MNQKDKSKQIPSMEGEIIAKRKIDFSHLYPQAKEKIKNLLNTKKFRTGRMITEKGYEVIELTEEKGKIIVELYDKDYNLHYFIKKEAPEEKIEEIMKTLQKSGIDDYDNGPIYAEFTVTEPIYEEIGKAIRKMKSKIKKRKYITQAKVRKI